MSATDEPQAAPQDGQTEPGQTGPGEIPPCETLDAFIGGRVVAAQPAHGYRAGLDAVMLAAAVPAATPAPETVLDLGAGVGVVGLCLAARVPNVQVTLLETQPELVALAARNIERNQLGQRVRVIAADVHDSPMRLHECGLLPDTFDHVVCNPPFDIEGHGRAPPNVLKARSHAMPAGELEHWARVLARYCRASGTVTMIHRADALGAVLAALNGRFGALHILPLHPRAGEPATRIIVQGIKGSRAPLVLLAGLVLHATVEEGPPANGAAGHGFTAPVRAILRDGAALRLSRDAAR
jgi:tRNA1(Val) A37 N6-methylase TrmN6